MRPRGRGGPIPQCNTRNDRVLRLRLGPGAQGQDRQDREDRHVSRVGDLDDLQVFEPKTGVRHSGQDRHAVWLAIFGF